MNCVSILYSTCSSVGYVIQVHSAERSTVINNSLNFLNTHILSHYEMTAVSHIITNELG